MKLKGGFQSIDISTADLTASTLKVDGLSSACAGSNDKPVRIKMPDGIEYYGSLKPTTGGFEISFIGAESEVVRISVDDTDDTFTIKESGEVVENITGGTETPVTLTTDNGVANPYIAPSDGYVRIENTSTSVDTTTAVTIPFSDRSNALPLFWSIPAGTSSKARREAFFVKRGTPIAIASKAGTTNVVFIALETEG